MAKDPSIPALRFIHKYEKLEAAPENPPEKCSRDRTGMKYYHVRAYMQHIERHVQGQDIFYRKFFDMISLISCFLSLSMCNFFLSFEEDEEISKKYPYLKFAWANFGKEQKARHNSLQSQQMVKQESRNGMKNKEHMRLWECPTCGYTTTHGGHYTQHLKVHDKSKRLPCPYCAYTAARPWHIKARLQHRF